jgi:hypothetical protein
VGFYFTMQNVITSFFTDYQTLRPLHVPFSLRRIRNVHDWPKHAALALRATSVYMMLFYAAVISSSSTKSTFDTDFASLLSSTETQY